MKKIILAGLILSVTFTAQAISEGYRKQLDKFGCTQMNDGHGCDIHKTKAQNQAAAAKAKPVAIGEVRGDAETILGMRANVALDYLLNHKYQPYGESDYVKGKWMIRVVIDKNKDYQVVNAQILPFSQ
ncbi:TPA: hypothetical protein I9Y23_000074 [Kluyvera ascorbata]|uniref:Uncharacterized protein n=1 Tax=Kluyvera genomosp. 2 TaxID=2774054 RepID=A0A2T2Y8B8_9ENTR|nr:MULTISPECIES: hypothetical protein [Enterobacteriaceae]HAT3916503.1 hypothetical protein [Kluyvera ascorbata]PSR48781.1 hypothetical protein C8256_01955 [Kluyvera genomosp. 2]BBQ83070.1 hypothetical protein WP3W18E02_15990 [Klebsiella sp. WP3-W18-ESBL-02]BBR20103.1 hypothetical protein WP3S18E05_15830 [Klebsiella sp. WP3-S18-ESBL-05]HAT3941416.1 hypothetical protein [Kluyvera ascorbata]